ncbi:MAG: alanine--tRNA ligase [Eubacteriales bacterium]|nr:alanine--tRNA ligase [Eubacteriales bacterium]
MHYMGLNEIREKFLVFFESKDHLRLPSFSLIPQGDKSLLLINSGMAPLKPYFTGEQEPPRRRVTTCQKCIRTGDIDNVGKTARHGTFFEMLGNFSFGDYFKKEAIAWSWEFLTEVMELDPNRLYPSIYEDDDEAFEIWNKDIGIAPERIFRFGKGDNFWEHGSGPCGPCSEIYYDRGEKYGCGKPGCTVGCDCDRYMEVWNNVFSQFNNDGHGNYTELEQKNIDTGMGLERLAVVMQDVDSLFDVDTVKNITNHISKISGKSYGESYKTDVSLRVITDHIRSTVMMICDGVIPSNEGRGYVLRRLLRRAARHGKLLGIDKPFLYQVCDTVIQESGGAYPALLEKQEYIRKVIQVEEERFDATVDAGLAILNDMIAKAKQDGNNILPAEDAFKLHDTYGFPIDLTIEILEEQGMSTDRDGFDALIQEQKERSREDRKRMGDVGWASEDLGLDKSLKTEFCGYTTLEAESQVMALITEGESTDAVRAGSKVTVVLDKTPFYAEMGGQVPDHGTISHGDCEIAIDNVQKNGDGRIYLHSGVVKSGVISRGDTVTAKVDAERRQAICRSHTATHLLQEALREVLGSHVEQAGSYTDADHVRFDFTHFAAMTAEEIERVENIVNNVILEGMEVRTDEMPIEEAKKLGAMALFGEKYGDIVRVVRAGDYSIEFCGGTHLDNTAKAGMFKIVSEASVAAGVRRIEALTGKAFMQMFAERQKMLGAVAAALKTSPNELVQRADQMVEDMRNLNRNIDSLNSKIAGMELVELFNLSREVAGVNVISAKLNDTPEVMRSLGDMMKERYPKAVAVLATVTGESKVQLLCVAGSEAVKAGAHAGKIVKEVAKLCGGGGGGRPDSASAGGKKPEKLEEALEAVNNIVANMLEA